MLVDVKKTIIISDMPIMLPCIVADMSEEAVAVEEAMLSIDVDVGMSMPLIDISMAVLAVVGVICCRRRYDRAITSEANQMSGLFASIQQALKRDKRGHEHMEAMWRVMNIERTQ